MVYDDSPEWIWGSLFKANEEDEFDMLASRYPEVQGAVAAIKELSADPNIRHQAIIEEMEWRDWLSWTDEAETKGRRQGLEQAAVNAINAGYDDAMVMIISNMTAEQVRVLRHKVAQKS